MVLGSRLDQGKNRDDDAGDGRRWVAGAAAGERGTRPIESDGDPVSTVP